jgi:hypothetical protein
VGKTNFSLGKFLCSWWIERPAQVPFPRRLWALQAPPLARFSGWKKQISHLASSYVHGGLKDLLNSHFLGGSGHNQPPSTLSDLVHEKGKFITWPIGIPSAVLGMTSPPASQVQRMEKTYSSLGICLIL